MPRRKLSVVAGGKSGKRQPKAAQPQNDIAGRWRSLLPEPPRKKLEGDVIPLLDGWIRRLQRQAGLDPAANER